MPFTFQPLVAVMLVYKDIICTRMLGYAMQQRPSSRKSKRTLLSLALRILLRRKRKGIHLGVLW